jgi:hypothetical protein
MASVVGGGSGTRKPSFCSLRNASTIGSHSEVPRVENSE